jgi:hypothetical protein
METESTPLLMRPAPWDPRRSTIAGGLVLVTLTLERLAFYALVANLFLFLSLGGWSPRGSMTAVLVLVGIAHFSALGGGWLADGLVSIDVSFTQIMTTIENFHVTLFSDLQCSDSLISKRLTQVSVSMMCYITVF